MSKVEIWIMTAKEIKMTQDMGKEFESLARPLIKFLNENLHPHAHIVITTTTAEISEGICAIETDDNVVLDI